MNYKELAFWLYCGDYCEVERLGLWQQVNASSWVPWGLKQMHIWSERFNLIGFTTKCCCLQSDLILENVIIKLTCLSVWDTQKHHLNAHTEHQHTVPRPPFIHTVLPGQGVNTTSHPSFPRPPEACLHSLTNQTQICVEAAVSAHEECLETTLRRVTPNIGCQQLL